MLWQARKNILRRSHLRNIAAAVVVHTLSVIATAGEWDCRVNGHVGGMDGWGNRGSSVLVASNSEWFHGE